MKMVMMLTMKVWLRGTLNWVQEDVAKFLQCSSIDSMLPSRPESGASLDLYLQLYLGLYFWKLVRININLSIFTEGQTDEKKKNKNRGKVNKSSLRFRFQFSF